MTSRAGFEATQGQTYHIAVDGVGGATGRIILNWNPAMHLTIQKLSAASFKLTLIGTQGTYSIEGSEDLDQWDRITTVTVTGSSQQYTDNAVASSRRRFYRAMLLQ